MDQHRRRIWIAAALGLLLAARYLTGLSTAELHPDESHWIGSSQVFEDFLSARFTSDRFNDSFVTRTQPPLPRYVIGAGRRLGGYRWVDLNRPWNYLVDEATNARLGNVPSEGLLWWSRMPMALLAVVSVMLGLVLLRQAAGDPAGAIWLALCANSAFFLDQLRRAMGEAPLLACTTLALWACYRALRSLRVGQPRPSSTVFLWLAAFGVFAGAAGAAKLNGLSLIVAGVMAGIAAATTIQTSASRKFLVACGAAALVTVSSTATFVGLNPYLWPDPVGRTQGMLEQRLDEMRIQEQLRPSVAIHTVGERVTVVPHRVFGSYASVNADAAFAINILLSMGGLWALAAASWRAMSQARLAPAPMAMLFVGLATATPPLFTPLDWDRYFLLPVFFTTMLIAIGAAVVCTQAYGRLRHHRLRAGLEA